MQHYTLSDFNRLTVVIKTFMRYDTLEHTISAFKSVSEDLKFIVVDDTPSKARKKMSFGNVRFIHTDDDIGVSAGRNIGFRNVETEYLFYSDDDMIPHFSGNDLLEALNFVHFGFCDLLGSNDGGYMSVDEENKCISMHSTKPVVRYRVVDYVDNFFLTTKRVMLATPHDDRIKMGGEHGLLFYQLMKNGVKVASASYFKYSNTHHSHDEYYGYRHTRSETYRRLTEEIMGGYRFDWSRNIPNQ